MLELVSFVEQILMMQQQHSFFCIILFFTHYHYDNFNIIYILYNAVKRVNKIITTRTAATIKNHR